jgi:predicted RNA binding protein YcfA (HicA-like mRNA interferase family)
MTFEKHVWAQLKNKTADELISALNRDGFQCDVRGGSARTFRHPDGRRTTIDYHPRKTFGPKLLKAILADTGWSEDDLARLRLVKR